MGRQKAKPGRDKENERSSSTAHGRGKQEQQQQMSPEGLCVSVWSCKAPGPDCPNALLGQPGPQHQVWPHPASPSAPTGSDAEGVKGW